MQWSGRPDAKGITRDIQVTARTMEDMDLITAPRLRFPSQSATGRTMFVVRDIGTEARTTSGDQDIGRGDMVSKSGFTAITRCGDTRTFG